MLNSAAVLAKPPTVSTDEAVYVNLDAYGALSEYSVVKGVALNGNTEFTDFGDYTDVINMSNHILPDKVDGGIQWRLEPGTERFYYECTFDDGQVQLPWTFDISYRLNGSPIAADMLAGAAGLVEITVHAIPNTGAQAYYRNNMILQLAYVADMQKTGSIEAPGSQLQSMGTYKVVLFMAMPGEEATFQINVGTDSFESTGVVMMMVPGTLSQLSLIAQLREARDEVDDAYQAGYDSYNALLSAIGAMKNPLLQLRDGFAAFDGTLLGADTFDGFESSTSVLADTLTSASQTALDFIPYLSHADDTAAQLFSSARTLNALAGNMKDDLNHYSESLSSLRTIAAQGKSMIGQYRASEKSLEQSKEELREVGKRLRETADVLSADLSGLNNTLQELKEPLTKLSKALGRLQDELEELSDIPKLDKNKFLYRGSAQIDVNVDGIVNAVIDKAVLQINNELDKASESGGLPVLQPEDFYISQQDYPQMSSDEIDQLNKLIDNGIVRVNRLIDQMNQNRGQTIENLKIGEEERQNLHVQGAIIEVDAGKITSSINRVLGTLIDSVNEKIEDLNDSLYFLKKAANGVLSATSGLVDAAQTVIDRLGPLTSDLQDIIKETGHVADAVESAVDDADLGDAARGTFDTADALLDELMAACDRGVSTIGLAQTGIDEMIRSADIVFGTEEDVHSAVNSGETTIKQLSGILSQAAQTLLTLNDSIDTLKNGTVSSEILDGMVSMLDNAAGQIDITGSLHRTGTTINDTIEKQTDKIEDQSNVLEVDPNAGLISFTSPQNPTPASIQIVLRSEEISLGSSANKGDLERTKEDGGVWRRIGNIFVKIWNAVVSIFQEE